MKTHNVMFKIIVPQLFMWCGLQIFYLSVHGFSKDNFKVPTVLLTLSNLLSSSILGNTVLELIVVWISIHLTTINFRARTYQIPYVITIATFTLLVMIFSGLTGVSPKYYFIFMRVTFSIFSIYLLICVVLLLFYGTTIYQDAAKSDTTDPSVIRLRTWVPGMLAGLCGVIFIPVLVLFIFYISATEYIEKSSFWVLFNWGAFWTGSIVYVNLGNFYFWRTTVVA